MSDNLPQGWAIAAVSEVTNECQSGFASGEKNVEAGVAHLRMNNIGLTGELVLDLVRTVPEKLAKPQHNLRPGDVLVCTTNSSKLVGKCAYFDLSGRYAFSNHLTRLRPKSSLVDGKFLRWNLWLQWKRGVFDDKCKHWVNQSTLPKDALMETEIVVPPLDEQRRIMAKLEKVLVKVNSSEERLTKIPVLLKRFRQSVLAAACSGRLTADWRTENPNLATNVELSPTADSENEWPQGWRVASLNEVAEKVQDGNYGALYPKADEWIDSGVAFLIPAAISADGKVNLDKVRFISPERNVDLKKAQLADGDVIFPNRGSRDAQRYGFEPFAISIPKTLLPANINPQLTLVRPRAEVLMSGFLRLALNAEFFLSQVREATGGSALVFINLTETKRLRIPIPPLAEQQEIVRRVGSLFASADPIEARYAKGKAHVEKLTQSILAKAFCGELVPQDPNDEPAEALLSRIHQQRKDGKKA